MAQIGSFLPIQPFDPLFKLFGRTISVGSCLSGNRWDCCEEDASVDDKISSDDTSCTSSSASKQIMTDEENGGIMCTQEEVGSCSSSSDVSGEETPEQGRSYDSDIAGVESKGNDGPGKQQDESDVLPASNRDNKISHNSLPCPRCSSMKTKFCYFNNYNVKQPRHFCKQCQRYWTAGGSLRNIPVGAGRRKHKHTGSLKLAFNDNNPVGGDRSQILYIAASHTAASKLQCQVSQVPDLQMEEDAAMNKKCSTEQNEISRKEAIEKNSQVEKDKTPIPLWSVHEPAFSPLEPAMCRKNGEHMAESKIDLGNSFCDPVRAQTVASWANGRPFICINSSERIGQNLNQNMSTSLPSTAIDNEGGGKLMQGQGNSLLWTGVPGGMWLFPYGPVLRNPFWNIIGWNWDMPFRTAAPRTASDAALTEASATGLIADSTSVLGKHPRERPCLEAQTRGSLLAPKALKLDDLNIASRKSIWTALGLENKPDSILPGRGQ